MQLSDIVHKIRREGVWLDELLQRSGHLSGLAPDAFAQLEAAADPFALDRGQTLFRQGMTADALYIVKSGALEIMTRIPGDTAASVSTIGPGEVVGEFALLDEGLRSASVTAMDASTGLRIPKSRFLALLADGKPWTLDLIDALRSLVARRTRATLARIATTSRYDVPSLRAPSPGGDIGTIDDGTPLFAALGRFAELGAEGAALLASKGTYLTIPRGTRISEAESAPHSLTLVLRGALRSFLPRDEGQEQIMVNGPGEMTGLVGLFDGTPHPLGLEAAENVIALQLPHLAFEEMRRSPEPHALALFAAIGRQLVRDQRRANRHLGRAVSLEQFNQYAGGGTL
jgi:CRP-like cAMP-binding protein